MARTQLGPYELLFELAAGGLGAVHVALHRGPGGFERLVVVKQPHAHLAHDKEFMTMFRDEARLASSIRHPNVVPVTDVVASGELLYLVMDYVESVSLSVLEKSLTGPLPPDFVSRIMVDALHGLHASHEATDLRGKPLGIVHRDVSPQNLLVGADGNTRVIDFGIARASQRFTETQSGVVKGKYAYMSPEQVEAEVVDRRSDVFSAGIVLFETMTGRRLFRADTEAGTIKRLLTLPIPTARSLLGDLPEALDDVLAIALAREPGGRFATAQAFAAALESAVKPARAPDVATWLRRTCGEILGARQTALQRALAGDAAAISMAPAMATATAAPHTFQDPPRTTGSLGAASAAPAPATEPGPAGFSPATAAAIPATPAEPPPGAPPQAVLAQTLASARSVPEVELHTNTKASLQVDAGPLEVPTHGWRATWIVASVAALALIGSVVALGARASKTPAGHDGTAATTATTASAATVVPSATTTPEVAPTSPAPSGAATASAVAASAVAASGVATPSAPKPPQPAAPRPAGGRRGPPPHASAAPTAGRADALRDNPYVK